MLKIPEIKFERSANKSNVDPNALCDWLEACALFEGPTVTKGDVVDLLIEGQVCSDDNQDLAHSIADQGWDELAMRKRWGGVPDDLDITSTRITCATTWQDDAIRAFFVLLSALRIYPEWAKGHQAHGVQGDLFERVVELICPHLLPGWTSYRAGWSPENTKDIPAIAAELNQRLYTSGAPDLDAWLMNAGNDGGLDIVCYRPFSDEREAIPAFFLQCASGKNWRTKVQTPNPELWSKILNSAVRPSTGIVAPFVIDSNELRFAALLGQVIVFDRIRLIQAAREGNVELPEDLAHELAAWMTPRVDQLPRAA
jgi:hypothetical protein